MRGFPLMRILGVAASLTVLGVPVWMLARDRAEVAIEERGDGMEAAEMAVFRVVLNATAPARLSVMAANLPLQESDGAVEHFEAEFKMSRSQPEDMAVFADFGGNTGTEALRAKVTAGGKVVADKTLWGEREIQDVVEIPVP